MIFCFWRATVLTFLKNGLKLLKDKALEIIPKYGRTEAKVGLGVGKRIIFETLQLTLSAPFCRKCDSCGFVIHEASVLQKL